MKLKALVLTAGLLAFGVTNAAWAYPPCTKGGGETRNSGNVCQSKNYRWNKNKNCTCPGYNKAYTQKCEINSDGSTDVTAQGFKQYSCQEP